MIPACFACHVDCAACTTEDQVAPFEYDHPPNFEDDIHDEEPTSPKRDPESESEGDMEGVHGYEGSVVMRFVLWVLDVKTDTGV